MELPNFITDKLNRKIPFIDLGKRDFTHINKDDFKNYDVVYGVNDNKFFISIYYLCNDEERITTIYQRNEQNRYLFYRYNHLDFCNSYYYVNNYFGGEFTNPLFQLFFDIINKGLIIINNDIGYQISEYKLIHYERDKIIEIKNKILLHKYVLLIQRNFKEKIQIPPNGWLVKKLLKEQMDEFPYT